MPINEKGEIIRGDVIEEQGRAPEEVVSDYYEALSTSSIPPVGVEIPDGLYYWAGERLGYNEFLFHELQRIVGEHSFSIIHGYDGSEIDVADFLARAEASVVFSRQVAENHAKDGAEDSEADRMARRDILDMLKSQDPE